MPSTAAKAPPRATSQAEVKKQEQLARLVQLCKQPTSQRTQDDVWFIRDRLHECSQFFRLWPAQLQQLLCRLLQARQWVQHEVLAAAGSKPEELCFIVDGEAAVAVRSAPGSSTLKDVALLHAGDTCGELCLLGKERHPAFVVVRSLLLTGLTVNAQALAAAMPAALQQAQGRASVAKGSSAAPTEVAVVQQDTVSVDALYHMIGQPRGHPQAQLKPAQADQVRQLYSRQLQEAAAAEAATVGTWQQLPHERLSSAGPSGRPATASRRRPAAVQAQAATAQHAGERNVYEVKIGDVLAIGSMAGAAQEAADSNTAQHRLASGELDIQQDDEAGAEPVTAGPAQQQQLEGHEQPQQTNRSPLMHHAAIMHFAALRAAAAGHPS